MIALTEHELIKKYFTNQSVERDDVILSIGDDGAIVAVPPGQQLVISTDLFAEGTHFLKTWEAFDVGHRVLSASLSDLAAMAAKPAWVTLGLSMPSANETWLDGFCQGFFATAKRYGIQLIGGDTNQGPWVISVQVHGFVDAGLALLRGGANVGDLIYVTGELGSSGFALQCLHPTYGLTETERQAMMHRLFRPTPQIETGQQLAGIASAAIDISDGLASDLTHIIASSQVGATLQIDALPINPILKKYLPLAKARQLALSHGDDYELCFTIAPKHQQELEHRLTQCQCSFSQIGTITLTPGLVCLEANGQPYPLPQTLGFEHFSHENKDKT